MKQCDFCGKQGIMIFTLFWMTQGKGIHRDVCDECDWNLRKHYWDKFEKREKEAKKHE